MEDGAQQVEAKVIGTDGSVRSLSLDLKGVTEARSRCFWPEA